MSVYLISMINELLVIYCLTICCYILAWHQPIL